MKIEPGATIGMMGGGQLGRMSAMSALDMGYKLCVFCPESHPPAAQVCSSHIKAGYLDQEALSSFADRVDVVTLEFENIPVGSLRFLETKLGRSRIRPSAFVLDQIQDRLLEKQFVRGLGIETVDFADMSTLEGAAALESLVFPVILKTRRLGYDGKGQVVARDFYELKKAWQDMGKPEAIVENKVDFALEISVLVARNAANEMRTYPSACNLHRNGILRETFVPSPISASLEEKAASLARKIACALGLEGLLAVELFVTDDKRLLVNELAPRPHNSGHWSMNGAATSQFEQHIRAVCNLPLGLTEILMPTRMLNLIGNQIETAADYLDDPGAHLHLYGKSEVKPGRKMGHVNFLRVETGKDQSLSLPEG